MIHIVYSCFPNGCVKCYFCRVVCGCSVCDYYTFAYVSKINHVIVYSRNQYKTPHMRMA